MCEAFRILPAVKGLLNDGKGAVDPALGVSVTVVSFTLIAGPESKPAVRAHFVVLFPQVVYHSL